jgi:transcriptional regulator with XRE-family HTH domain
MKEADDKAAAEHARRLAKKRVEELRQEKGITYADISRRCGKGPQYISEYFKRGNPRWLPEQVRRRFSKFTEMDENLLRPPQDAGETHSPTAAAELGDQRADVMAAVDAIAKVRARKAAFDAAFDELEPALARFLRPAK